MEFHILTLFPDMFEGPLGHSILQRARDRGLVRVFLHNIRDYATDRHHVVDDAPYGGGPGMVMKPEPIFEAVESVRALIAKSQGQGGVQEAPNGTPVVLMSPKGRPFSQRVALELSKQRRIILVCGHYEGVDERVSKHLATDEISVGDFVLTGGELPAMVVVDAVARLVPGVLGSEESLQDESHTDGLLQFPQYTRPAAYRGWTVPEVLLSGHHQEIDRWRRKQSILQTERNRPDLLASAGLSDEEKRLLAESGDDSRGGPD